MPPPASTAAAGSSLLTLGYSRKSIRLLTMRSSARIWAELHEQAFRRLGGVPRVVVLDNLKGGVLRPDWYAPTLNPLYRDVLAHYGVTALPCRVADPDREGKVEAGVGHTQRTPLKGQHFETVATGQTHLDHWEERWADTRIHGTTSSEFVDETRGCGSCFAFHSCDRTACHAPAIGSPPLD